jgi:hypothetical protein
LQIATISFLMYDRPSIRPSTWNNSVTLDRFSWSLIFEYFSKSCRTDRSLIKIRSNKVYITWRPIYLFGHLAHFFFEWKMHQTKVVEKIETHILCSIIFFYSFRLLYCRAGQATDDSMAHAHCMLNNNGYKHTLRTCSTYCFSTAKMIGRTCLNVTLPVHCLSFWIMPRVTETVRRFCLTTWMHI